MIGPFKDFDITGDRGRIRLPTLLFCAEFDEVTPATMGQAYEGIPGSEFVVTSGCSMSQAERPEATLGMIRGWLAGWRPRTAALTGTVNSCASNLLS